MRRARLGRCTAYSLACGLKDWKQMDGQSVLRLSVLLHCGRMTHKVVFILELWVLGSAHVTILVRGL